MNTIKSIKRSIFTLAFCATGIAYADYSCTSHDGQVTIKMNEEHITPVGNTMITVQSEENAINYYGVTKVSGGHFMTKKVVYFIYHNGALTIIDKPKFCGRASCDYSSGPIITGKLELDNSEIHFSCHE
ncbi:hypothetical protein OAB57_01050 [Bacteriovoracaceae bacterium]|nr:hypothetical protein [Bacteriovoracaceae bacterium]